jgi:hypothetical protein
MKGEAIQDDGLTKGLMREQQRLEAERAPWETTWKEIEERVNPEGAGGFTGKSPGAVRGAGNFDATAILGLDRFTAAIAGMTIPRGQVWHGLKFADKELDKLPEVRRWAEYATDRLFALRYAPKAGFEVQAHEDIRSLGSYGTAPFWVDEWRGRGLFYKALHLSECYIDEDFRGRVDTVHRKFERTARQCAQHFGDDNLSPKMAKAIADGKHEEQFQILHVVRPNPSVAPDAWDWRGKRIGSIYIAIDEKWVLRRGGFHSMPIPVSRHVTSPRDKYGRSPAMKVLPTIKGANQMARTILRAGHKATDPALAFYDDDGITSLVTKPGGLNPGLVDEAGRLLVQALPTGSNLPVGMELLNNERGVIQAAFLEEFFKLLVDPSDRMTATQVLETVAKEGVLVSPFVGRHETEKLAPMIERELDIAMRAGWIEPPPAVVYEAGGGSMALVNFENPLARMARAEEAAGLVRWIEAMTPMQQVAPEVFDWIDTDEAPRGLAEVLGVRPSWVATPEAVAAKRKAREQQQEGAEAVAGVGEVAGAYLDMAKANALQEQAA